MNIVRKIKALPLQLASLPIRESKWFNSLFVDADGETYPSNDWYRRHEERNFDVVVLGSASAKWAFDFRDCGLKCMNWAQAPQTLVEDYRLLRNFHSILRSGGYVIITVMPFTSLNKQTGIYDAFKYLKINSQEPIEPHLYEEACRYFHNPLLFGRPAISAGIRYLLRREWPTDTPEVWADTNPMDEDQLKRDALHFVNGWKSQFGIGSFDDDLTAANIEARRFRVGLMQTVIDFCLERDYQPVYLIPPVTTYLASHFTPRFQETYIYSFLKEVQRDIPLLDYSKVAELQDKDLYFNSIFLNQRGRKMFTQQVLSDLQLLH